MVSSVISPKELVSICIVVFFLGAVYWYVKFRVLPRRGGYALVKEDVIQEDGVSRQVFRKVPATTGGGYMRIRR